MNRIVEVKLTYHASEWKIEVTKEFALEHGGGSQVFVGSGGSEIHEALRRAAEMVTLTPSHNYPAPLCPGCGGGKGWIENNPAYHEERCGGVGKSIFERKGIPLDHGEQLLPDPPQSHDYDSDGNPRRRT